jgi:two-component system chemotaxis response regulator CheY
MNLRILSVGQCGIDGPRIKSVLQHELNADVTSAADADEATDLMKEDPFDLVLVNRLLAGDSSSGLDVIQAIRQLDQRTPVMLVSDIPEAQQSAVGLGALPGFGKTELESRETHKKILSAVGRNHQPSAD